jgi:hypothetical protein
MRLDLKIKWKIREGTGTCCMCVKVGGDERASRVLHYTFGLISVTVID